MAGAGVVRQDRKSEDPLISGLLKIGTGSAKALAGGAVNLVKGVPGGVGKLIGAREKTPPQYISDPGMEDISAGVSALKRAGGVITSVPGRTRKGIMSVLDLEELPTPDSPVPRAITQTPSTVIQQSPTSFTLGTGKTLTIEEAKKQIADSRVPEEKGTAPEMAGYVKNFGTGKTVYVPKTQRQEEDLNTKIDALVDKLYTDPRNRVPGDQRLRKGVLGAITSLRATQAGLAGTKADAEAKAEYHKILRNQLSAKGMSADDISKIAERFTPKEQKVMEIDPESGIPREVVKPPDYKTGLQQTQTFLKSLGYDVDFGLRNGGIDPADFESSYTSSLKASGKKDTPKARAAAMKRYKELMGIKE